MANNEVLAGLQRAYLASDNTNTKAHIRYTWRAETKQHSAPFSLVDAEIRAWQPEQPDPLAENMARLLDLAGLINSVDGVWDRFKQLSHQQTFDQSANGKALTDLDARITSLEQQIEIQARDILELAQREADRIVAPQPAPEPDDAVCARDGCGHPKSQHNYRGGACDYLPCHCPAFLPAPPAAPPLDPVPTLEQRKAAVVTALRRYHTITANFDKSSIERMAFEVLMALDGVPS